MKKSNCLLAFLVGVVAGIVVAALFAYEYFPNIATSVWVTLGTTGVLLLVFVAIITAAVIGRSGTLIKCVATNGACLLLSIIGSFILSLLGVSINLDPANFLVTVLVGIGTMFVSMMLISFYLLINCIINRFCHVKCED